MTGTYFFVSDLAIKIIKPITRATSNIPVQTPALNMAPIASQLLSKILQVSAAVTICKFLFILIDQKE